MAWIELALGDFLKERVNRFKPNDIFIKNLQRVDKIDFSGKIYLSNSPSKTDMILIKEGDLLISGINVYKGAIAVYQGNEDITATIHYSSYSFDKRVIDIDFLKLYLKSPHFLKAIKEQIPGGIKTEIKSKQLLPIRIIIPELIEQQEIVKRYLHIASYLNLLENNLEWQENTITKFRQLLLKEAIEGKLISQDLNDEPASELIVRIKAEKEILEKEVKLKREKPLSPIKPEEIPFTIPNGWVWCRLGDISFLKRGKSKHRPRNDNILFENGTYPFIQTGDVSNSRYTNFKIKSVNGYYNDFGLKQSQIQEAGTLCVTIAANIAECGFLEFDACLPDSIVCIRSLSRIIEKYIFYFILNGKKNIQTYAPATAQKNINLGILNELLIPVPPIKEQERIINKLDILMKYCESLENVVKSNKELVKQLTQSKLMEALLPIENEVA